MKSIQLTLDEWNKILDLIKKEFPPSYYLIRATMKRELGFTTRYHRARPNASMILDFFDEEKKTLFILKYM